MSVLFENDVEMYGAQTICERVVQLNVFENDVEMYGAQTAQKFREVSAKFENDVEMYGAQTHRTLRKWEHCLRMMQKCMVLKLVPFGCA